VCHHRVTRELPKHERAITTRVETTQAIATSTIGRVSTSSFNVMSTGTTEMPCRIWL
jgi:hypothetical protein